MEKDQVGAYKKRPGYITYLGTADGQNIVNLFSWQKDDGTTVFNYRHGSTGFYRSAQGTAAWTVCNTDDLLNGKHIGYAVLEDTLVFGQAGDTPYFSASGTSFGTEAAAPQEEFFASKFNRIWAGGTSSNLYYSTAGTPDDWSSDSSSIKIPGPGKINGLFICNDRVIITKNSGLMFTYDDYNLRQVPTNMGPSSPYSLAETEDYWFYLNRDGFFGFNGDRPKLLSNAVEKQIYNDSGNGIAGTSFDAAPGVCYRYDYLCAVGTVKDDITDEEVGNCIMKYDYQLDEWSNWKFADFPSAWTTYKDTSGNEQLIFGSGNQCYQFGGTATSDNGNPIEAIMEGVLHFDDPSTDKKFNWLKCFTSPGCSAKVAVAVTDTIEKANKKWMDIGDLHTGCKRFEFPSDSRGKLLFWKLYEYSATARFHFYGFVVDVDAIGE